MPEAPLPIHRWSPGSRAVRQGGPRPFWLRGGNPPADSRPLNDLKASASRPAGLRFSRHPSVTSERPSDGGNGFYAAMSAGAASATSRWTCAARRAASAASTSTPSASNAWSALATASSPSITRAPAMPSTRRRSFWAQSAPYAPGEHRRRPPSCPRAPPRDVGARPSRRRSSGLLGSTRCTPVSRSGDHRPRRSRAAARPQARERPPRPRRRRTAAGSPDRRTARSRRPRGDLGGRPRESGVVGALAQAAADGEEAHRQAAFTAEKLASSRTSSASSSPPPGSGAFQRRSNAVRSIVPVRSRPMRSLPQGPWWCPRSRHGARPDV